MSVEVIVTYNRLTELTTPAGPMSHVTVGRRAFDVRSRVTINSLKDSHDLWRVARGGSSRQGWVESRRRGVDQTLQRPVVVTIPTAYKRLSDARSTLGAPVGFGGGLAAEEAGDSCG